MKRRILDEGELLKARDAYEPRVSLLKAMSKLLEGEAFRTLAGVKHVDRISFRHKDAKSFAEKSLAVDALNVRKYQRPLEEIEDQVAGRVLVFFRRDLDPVVEQLKTTFTAVEQVRKAPSDRAAFAYESDHLVFLIPPNCLPPGWSEIPDAPTTFEMQVRTLAMHAWAEPEHDILYKNPDVLTQKQEREIAWAASNAWGMDEIFETVLVSIERTPANDQEQLSDSARWATPSPSPRDR